MKAQKKQSGFTLIEMIMSLVLLAMLMTAVAVAFDASIKNYHDNESLYKTMNTARAALLRITNDVRTAQAVATIGGGANEDPDNTQLSLQTAGGSNYTYRFDSTSGTLYLDDNSTGACYTLCENVTAITFNRATAVVGSFTVVRNVRISMSVTDEDGDLPQTLAAAAVVRRNL